MAFNYAPLRVVSRFDENTILLNRAGLSKILDEVALTAAQSAENRLARAEKTADLSRAPQPGNPVMPR